MPLIHKVDKSLDMPESSWLRPLGPLKTKKRRIPGKQPWRVIPMLRYSSCGGRRKMP